MSKKQNRRQFVIGLGVAGLAGISGCVGQIEGQFDDSGDGDLSDDERSDGGHSDDEDEIPTPDPDESLHSGETIPTYPYVETGSEPLNPRPDPDVDNPVLTAEDVDDLDAAFVSDPYLFVEEDEWHMFFHVSADGRGRIAYAYSDDEGQSWEYDRVVLNLRHHVSHPLVFKWDGAYYMTTHAVPSSRPIRLYRANAFPYDWYSVADLYDPGEYDHGITDHSLFYWDDRWWSIGGDDRRHTYLYHSEDLEATDWQPHDQNPVVEDRPNAARPGGRPIVTEDEVLVFFQSQVGGFGMEINAHRITELTPDTYEDERHPASPLVTGTDALDADDEPAWNAHRMHHYDPWYLGDGEGWRVAVDGDDGNDDWAIGIYRVRE